MNEMTIDRGLASELLRKYADTLHATDEVKLGIYKAASFIADSENMPAVTQGKQMRKCKGKAVVWTDNRWQTKEFELGYFHRWGGNYEKFDTGIGNYSTAIVELPDGQILMPVASDICFLDD